MDEALAPIDWKRHDAYAQASARVRFFMRRLPLRELLRRASERDLELSLRRGK